MQAAAIWVQCSKEIKDFVLSRNEQFAVEGQLWNVEGRLVAIESVSMC